ncbi:unnamed protein product [Musa hybrid cultivar]
MNSRTNQFSVNKYLFLIKLLGNGGSDNPCVEGSNIDRDKRGQGFGTPIWLDHIPKDCLFPFVELPVGIHPPQSTRHH